MQVRGVPTQKRSGIFDAEHTKSGAHITHGVLSGSQVQLPVSPHTRPSLGSTRASGLTDPRQPQGTISFADTAHPSRRYRDPASLETAHRNALQSDPRAFHQTSGLASRYDHHSTIQRHLLPTLVSSQRLTAVEDTLRNMTLFERTGQHAGVTSSRMGASLAVTTPRFDGVSANSLRRSMTRDGTLRRHEGADRALEAAMTWRPSSVPINDARATARAVMEGETLAMSVPAPTPLLAVTGQNSDAFVSRASSAGITPRGRITNLAASMHALVEQKAGQGVGSGTFTLQTTPMRARSSLRSSLRKRSASPGSPAAVSSENATERTLGLTGTPRAFGVYGEQLNYTGRPDAATEEQWRGVRPRDTMLTQLHDGPELVRRAVLQTRALVRQSPRQTTDLTHRYVDEGTWATLNLGGNTRSPTRRPLQPSPTKGNTQSGSAPDAFVTDKSREGAPDAQFGFAETGVTPLGAAFQSRQGTGLKEAPGGPEALRLATQPLLHTADFSAELRALDAFEATEAARAAGRGKGTVTGASASAGAQGGGGPVEDPGTWTKKVLISKIKHSGLAEDVGFNVASGKSLESADHPTLVQAYQRLGSAARRKQMLASTNRKPSELSDYKVEVTNLPGSNTPSVLSARSTTSTTADVPLRVTIHGRGVGQQLAAPDSGSYHAQPSAAYSAGIAARVDPPHGRKHFSMRQGDVLSAVPPADLS